MTIPREIRIGAHLVSIKLEMTEFDTDCGESNFHKNLIVLNGNLPQTQLEATLIHEIFHYLNSTMDHTLLDSLSQQIYQVLKDNNMLK